MCDKTFTEKRDLVRHCIFHTEEKPYSCSVCDKIFTQKGTLNQHYLVHTGEKPYSCRVCDKTFTQKRLRLRGWAALTSWAHRPEVYCTQTLVVIGTLNENSLVHSEEKLYSCSVCGKTFNQGGSLKHHIRQTGEKSYSCSMCDKTFIWKRNLVRHCLVHTEEKPYSCSMCNKAFT
ncbi:zinc finger protein 501 [Parasteatoda tepidariorum]|uniref:zinc finger protein 501 n=1 Tax=Parasteatoda tepidariorum TaxID=114398 RepID=UPI0039BC4A8A